MATQLIRISLLITLLCCLPPVTGCAALIDASFRELDDEDDDSRYEHQSFGRHFVDALLEGDDDDECHCRDHHHHSHHH